MRRDGTSPSLNTNPKKNTYFTIIQNLWTERLICLPNAPKTNLAWFGSFNEIPPYGILGDQRFSLTPPTSPLVTATGMPSNSHGNVCRRSKWKFRIPPSAVASRKQWVVGDVVVQASFMRWWGWDCCRRAEKLQKSPNLLSTSRMVGWSIQGS